MVNMFFPSWSVFVEPIANRSESDHMLTREIFEVTTPSARDIKFQSRSKNRWTARCSGLSVWWRVSARYLYATNGGGLFPSVWLRPSSCLSCAPLCCEPFFFPWHFHIIIDIPWHIALSEEIDKWWHETIIWRRFEMDRHLPIGICIILDNDGVIWWTIAGECFWKVLRKQARVWKFILLR